MNELSLLLEKNYVSRREYNAASFFYLPLNLFNFSPYEQGGAIPEIRPAGSGGVTAPLYRRTLLTGCTELRAVSKLDT